VLLIQQEYKVSSRLIAEWSKCHIDERKFGFIWGRYCMQSWSATLQCTVFSLHLDTSCLLRNSNLTEHWIQASYSC
jgi:hypothetical protein